jgi:large subunit ribosomal protein L24
VRRHTRPNPQRNIKGGIAEREAPIHASNVIDLRRGSSAPASGPRSVADGTAVAACQGVLDK